MSERANYQRNREKILNRGKEYYKNNIEILRQQAKSKCTEFSDEEKNIKREYGRNRYHNMSKEKKQRLKEYQKKFFAVKKSKKALFNN